MTQSEEAEAVESVSQYASVWKVLVGTIPGADLTDRPGLSIRWAVNDFPFWNAVFLTEQLVVLRLEGERNIRPLLLGEPNIRFRKEVSCMMI
jgi:hypothetical protein